MPDYKETSISGKTWQRANKIEITNILGQTPSICFHEENITQTSSGIIKQPISNCSLKFDSTNPTHLLLYQELNKLYIEARELRDNPAKANII